MTSDLASKQSRICFRIQYGGQLHHDYGLVNIAQRLTTPFGVFDPDPKLEVELPAYTAGLREGIVRVTFAVDNGVQEWVDIAEGITSGAVWAETYVTIYELEDAVVPGSPMANPTTLRYLYHGIVQNGILNAKGKEGLCTLVVASAKSNLDFSLGIQANPGCDSNFGDLKGCQFDFPLYVEQGILESIDGLIAEISGIGMPWLGAWDRGFVQKDKARSLIRFRDGDTDFFHLSQLIPQEWIGTAIEVKPGCRKTPEDCAVRGQTANFGGMGLGLLDHHPVFENGV